MDFKIAVLAGDGIGPEISTVGVDVMTAVCEKFGHKVNYEYAICGADAIDKVGDPFPEATYEACKNADAVLFSAVGDPKFDNDPTAKVRPEQGLLAMRKKLGLFANIRPVQTFKCLLHKSPLRAELVDGADFLCIRELTGGMYFGEKYQDNDKAYDTNMYTRPEIERILKVGFEYAMKRNKHLTVVDKANVLASSRLWRQIAQEMAPQYPEVTTDYMFVDNAAMKMIQEPKFFDVMVTENTFGDILTDEGSCISGSMGLLPSASTGESDAGIRAYSWLLAASERFEYSQSAGANFVCSHAFRILRPERGRGVDSQGSGCFTRCECTYTGDSSRRWRQIRYQGSGRLDCRLS